MNLGIILQIGLIDELLARRSQRLNRRRGSGRSEGLASAFSFHTRSLMIMTIFRVDADVVCYILGFLRQDSR